MILDSEYRGRWWLPENPEELLPGVLKPTADGESVLELSGSFEVRSHIQSLSETDLVLGMSDSGKKITLYKCLETGTTISAPGFTTSVLSPSAVFVGAHFLNVAQITFKKLFVHLAYLDEWVNRSGFDIQDLTAAGDVTIKYARPEPVLVKARDDLSVGFDVSLSGLRRDIVQTKVNLVQKTYLRLEPSSDLALEQYLELMSCVQDFLTLAVNRAVYPLSMQGKTEANKEAVNGKDHFPLVDVYYLPAQRPVSAKKVMPYDMLFEYSDIAGRFEQLLATWFEKAETLGPVLSLYFGTLYNPRMYIEHSFLNLIHAVEAFHERVHGGEYISSAEYEPICKDLVAAIPEVVGEDHRQSLKSKLKFGNEFSLRKRLKETFIDNEEILCEYISNQRKFIGMVVDTRNYLIHHDEELREVAASGSDLFWLTEKLRVLVETCLLRESGFSKEEISNLFQRNKTYQWRKQHAGS